MRFMFTQHLNESSLGLDKPIITAPDPIERNTSIIAESSHIFDLIVFAYGGAIDISNHLTDIETIGG